MAYESKTTVSTAEEGYAVLETFLKDRLGYNYAFLTREDDGSFLVTEKRNMPCYGEMRPYKKLVNPLQASTRGTDKKPGDLPYNFPKGEVLGFSVAKYHSETPDIVEIFTTDPLSPWRAFTQHPDLSVQRDGSGNIAGYVFKSGDIPPSVVVNYLMSMRNLHTPNKHGLPRLQAMGLSDIDAAVVSLFFSTHWQDPTKATFQTPVSNYELRVPKFNIPRFVNGMPYDLDGGLTFKDRAAYNRPNIDMLFGHRVDDYPELFKVGAPMQDTDVEKLAQTILSFRGVMDERPWDAEGKDPLVSLPDNNYN